MDYSDYDSILKQQQWRCFQSNRENIEYVSSIGIFWCSTHHSDKKERAIEQFCLAEQIVIGEKDFAADLPN
jgi:hypothetical protein